MGADQTTDGLDFVPDVEDVGLVVVDDLVVLGQTVDQCLQILEFHQVVSLVNGFVFADGVSLLLEFLVVLKMYLFCYEILLPRKLLDPQIYGLLQVLDLLLELFDLFIQDLDSLLMLLVLFEHSSQLLLLDHYLIEYRVVIDQVSSLQFCVSLEILVLLLGVFDARTQGV